MKTVLLLLLTVSTGLAQPPGAAPLPNPQTSLRAQADTSLPDDAQRHAIGSTVELKFRRGWQTIIKPSLSLKNEFYDVDASGLGLGDQALPDQATLGELGLATLHFTESGWSYFAKGEVGFAAEDESELGEDPTYLVLAAAARQFKNGNKFGLGLVAKQDVEEDWRVFPVPTIEVHLAKDWTLTTERAIHLHHDTGAPTTFGLGLNYLNSRFRTDTGTIFEYNAAPAFVETRHSMQNGLQLTARLGALVWGEIEIDDARGRGVDEADIDPGFHAAVEARWSFR